MFALIFEKGILEIDFRKVRRRVVSSAERINDILLSTGNRSLLRMTALLSAPR